jgi:hypothetical protein
MKRSRSKPPDPFEHRLTAFAKQTREKASFMPPGSERDDLIRKASRADSVVSLDDWAQSLFSELASK